MSVEQPNASAVEPTGPIDLEAIERHLRQREGAYRCTSYLARAVLGLHRRPPDFRCAADVPALLDEVERLRTLVAALVADPSNDPSEPWVPVFRGGDVPTGSAP